MVLLLFLGRSLWETGIHGDGSTLSVTQTQATAPLTAGFDGI